MLFISKCIYSHSLMLGIVFTGIKCVFLLSCAMFGLNILYSLLDFMYFQVLVGSY